MSTTLFTPQFTPGHSAFVAYALETGTITESPDGTTPASLPAAPDFSGASFIGYTDVPQQDRGTTNSQGFGIGSPQGLYIKRGPVQPRLVLELRAGALAVLNAAVRDSTTGALPWLCIWTGVPGLWTDVYRFCKVSTLTLQLTQSTTQAREAQARMQLEALARTPLTTALAPASSSITSLGTPLFWHDLLNFVIAQNGGGAALDFRQALTGLEITLNHDLERAGQRANWGDDQPLSRTAYTLQERLLQVSGQAQLHDRLPEQYFTAAATAQDWGDISLLLSDSPAGGTQQLAITLNRCTPTHDQAPATPAADLQRHSIAFSAGNFELTAA